MASIFKRKGSTKYLIKYRDETGRRREQIGTTDKQVTQRIAAKLEDEVRLRTSGVIDAAAEKLAASESRPIEEHLTDFTTMMEAGGRTARHIEAIRNYINRMVEACGFHSPGEIDAAKVSSYVAELRRQGLGARAANARIGAMKSFTRWMVRGGKMRTDLMVQVTKLNERTDRRHERRALTDDEAVALIEAASQGDVVRGMNGSTRAMCYMVALETGLRVSELQSLTPTSFDLADLDNATLTVRAAYSKHRREDVLPIRRDLAEQVARFVEGMESDDQLFRLPDKTAKMLKVDLEAAGIPFHDDAGRVVDFHALRHTFISRLARSGVWPSVAKTLARHSTITLTIDRYTHTLVEDGRTAVEKLPAIIANADPVTMQATGTDPPHQIAHHSDTASCHSVSTHGTNSEATGMAEPVGDGGANQLKTDTVSNACHDMPTPDNTEQSNTPRRTRTCNPLIKSQLLYRLS